MIPNIWVADSSSDIRRVTIVLTKFFLVDEGGSKSPWKIEWKSQVYIGAESIETPRIIFPTSRFTKDFLKMMAHLMN